jgi:hypothetical protein
MEKSDNQAQAKLVSIFSNQEMENQMTKEQKAKKAAKSDKNPFPIIGHMVYWTIRELESSFDEMQAKIDASLGRKYMPDSPSMRKALRLALEAIESKGIITRIPNDDGGTIAYTLHKKKIDKVNIDLDLDKEQTIVFNKAKDTLVIKDKRNRQEIMDLVAKYSTVFTATDIRNTVLAYLKNNSAITMRETGGIYFTSDLKVKNDAKSFVESMGGVFYAFGIPDEDAEKSAIHQIVKDEIDTDLQLATEALKQFLSTSKGRIDALENRMEQFNEIKAKAEMYRDLLSADVEELGKQIDIVSQEVTDALMGEIAEYPQARAFPLHNKVIYSGKSVEKYGDCGEIIGYLIGKESCGSKQYCRILFDGTNKVGTIAINSLKLVA